MAEPELRRSEAGGAGQTRGMWMRSFELSGESGFYVAGLVLTPEAAPARLSLNILQT